MDAIEAGVNRRLRVQTDVNKRYEAQNDGNENGTLGDSVNEQDHTEVDVNAVGMSRTGATQHKRITGGVDETNASGSEASVNDKNESGSDVNDTFMSGAGVNEQCEPKSHPTQIIGSETSENQQNNPKGGVNELRTPGAGVNGQDSHCDASSLEAARKLISDLMFHFVNADEEFRLTETERQWNRLLARYGEDVNRDVKDDKKPSVVDTEGEAVLLRPWRKIVRALIEDGADVNVQNESGDTALMVTVESVILCNEGIRALLEAGADVNLANGGKDTALTLAAKYRNEEVVLWLLAAGADVNAQHCCGETALMCAAMRGMLKAIQAGADVNLTDVRGESALMK